jgi:CPA1 family monovalent cation:H+ antiporter
VLFGFLLARLFRHIVPIVTGTLGGNLLEFITSFGVWVIAERLGLSPVLSLVAFAMTIARTAGITTAPRMRVHSFAVWETVVFLLNVLAFLLMGFQAREIVGGMAPDRLIEATWFALAVIACLIVVRMGGALAYNRVAAHLARRKGEEEPASLRHGVLIGWCGMRGLVTLATAFALPAQFPQRDLIVLTAFAVVLATLVLQGLTLGPLVRLLKLDGEDGLERELADARADMAGVALAALEGKSGAAAEHWRYGLVAERAANSEPADCAGLTEKRKLGRIAMQHQRKRLEQLRSEQKIDADGFLVLQEELDFHEIALSSEDERHIEES